jgi:hypothetical protein
MKAGQITAKLRDAVPVSFIEEDKELKRYKNIDIPDALKELEIKDFKFDVKQDGKIEFHLNFAKGILPKEFPANRVRLSREERKAQKAAKVQEQKAAAIVVHNIAKPVKRATEAAKPTPKATATSNTNKPTKPAKK